MTNELYHYKYIKREKVGDKWKYYYDTDSLKGAKTKFEDKVGITAKRNMQTAKTNFDNAKANEKAAKSEYDRAVQAHKDNVKRGQQVVEGKQSLSDMSATVKNDKFAYSKGGNKRQSEDVKRIQTALKDLGYDINTDGKFDDNTYKAVMKYQKDQGLRINGIVGEETLAALEKSSGASKNADGNSKEQLELANQRARAMTHKRIDAGNRYAEAQKEYMNSPLYKIENATGQTRELYEHAKQWASTAALSTEQTRSKSTSTRQKHEKRALIRDDDLPDTSPANRSKTRSTQSKKNKAVVRNYASSNVAPAKTNTSNATQRKHNRALIRDDEYLRRSYYR